MLLLLLQIFTTLALSALLQQRASYVYGALELMGAGFAFKKGVLFILGAREGLLDPLTIRYAEEYMCIILCGANA